MSHAPDSAFDPIEEVIAEIAAGRPVIVTDDEDRENEGDLIMAAAKATPETITMMIRHCSGIICVPMLEPQLRRLGLGPMVARNREVQRTDFTVSVDAAQGIGTGISAADRTTTIRLLADPATTPEQLVQPGHVFPLRARPGGVLQRAGHTEAAVDLAVLAGLPPAGVICELVNDDGTVQRLPQLIEFKRRFGLKMTSIEQLIEYRTAREKHVQEIGRHEIATRFGPFAVHVFRSELDGRHHFALVKGALGPGPTLVRVHRENVLQDLLQGEAEPGRAGIPAALERIARHGSGVLLILSRANEGAQLCETIRGESAPPSARTMLREYGIGAQILHGLGLREIRLLAASGRKPIAIEGHGLSIVEHLTL
jgi:3,4-dihydroxy 2-butanone 4-phosphate synthase/GTP cyclohydrolase II